MDSLHSDISNFGIGLLGHLCGHKHLHQQIDQPRHGHVPATIQKRIFKRFVLGLNPVVRVVVELPPNAIGLDPHLQINFKELFLLQQGDIYINNAHTLIVFTFFFGAHWLL